MSDPATDAKGNPPPAEFQPAPDAKPSEEPKPTEATYDTFAVFKEEWDSNFKPWMEVKTAEEAWKDMTGNKDLLAGAGEVLLVIPPDIFRLFCRAGALAYQTSELAQRALQTKRALESIRTVFWDDIEKRIGHREALTVDPVKATVHVSDSKNMAKSVADDLAKIIKTTLSF